MDATCAIKDLKEIGFEFTPEHLEKLKIAEAQRLQQRAIEKAKKLERQSIYGEDSNDTFFYIAGYTSGGAPYGVTWEKRQC